MAKIIKQIMKNGFVVLNLNTNENSFARALNGAEPENSTIDQTNTTPNSMTGSRSSQTGFGTSQNNILPISLNELAALLEIDLGVLNTVDLQGSRLYGTDHSSSDWDIIVIGDIPSFVPNALRKTDSFGQNTHLYKEVITQNGDKIQAHMFTTEQFYKSLNSYDIPSIEVIYHPSSVKVLSEIKFEMPINNEMLAEAALKESSLQWNKAKKIINDPEEKDKYPALKRVWHSFRYLIFAEQILKDGAITDFSAANYLYNGIINAQFSDFTFFEENYLPLKIEIQNMVKSLASSTNKDLLDITKIANSFVGGTSVLNSNVSSGGVSSSVVFSGSLTGDTIIVDGGSVIPGETIIVDGGSIMTGGPIILDGGSPFVLGG